MDQVTEQRTQHKWRPGLRRQRALRRRGCIEGRICDRLRERRLLLPVDLRDLRLRHKGRLLEKRQTNWRCRWETIL